MNLEYKSYELFNPVNEFEINIKGTIYKIDVNMQTKSLINASIIGNLSPDNIYLEFFPNEPYLIRATIHKKIDDKLRFEDDKEFNTYKDFISYLKNKYIELYENSY